MWVGLQWGNGLVAVGLFEVCRHELLDAELPCSSSPLDLDVAYAPVFQLRQLLPTQDHSYAAR